MTGTQPSPDRVPIAMRGWLRATSLGWLLGVPCILVLALVGEAIEIGGAQVLVGLGMGSAVGLLQGRAMRPVLGDAWPWLVASGVGLALPFLVADIAALREWELRYSLQWCVTIGGVIVGAWQALLLRARVRGTAWWLAASALGWTLAGTAARAADALTGNTSARGIAGALLFLVIVAAGGVVLGLVTGAALPRLVPRGAGGRVAAEG